LRKALRKKALKLYSKPFSKDLSFGELGHSHVFEDSIFRDIGSLQIGL
jgi:hypothetical protein